MLYFLLLISFLLHAVTFIIIKVLKDRIAQPDDIQTQMSQQQKEMEELLAVYLLEIREENEKFLDTLKRNPNVTEKKEDLITDAVATTSREKTKNVSPIDSSPSLKTNESKSYQPPIENDQQDIVERSLSAQVLSLHNQGESIESIARKLDCGKTEIELMIKFHQKNS
ncbi:swarming motility protein SwrB [Paraliobacillus quinghaiensis]|uniref:Swarming motility protein SwrB n=1 Tax=Paraliobacillus quinghaiensis TaxID=470815 RepID=A0A917TFT3_9BACI|nr:hypothetical protein [Paraliobacillus quinghaiensis]GGM21625.1 swarming motility protein SwrB [Paraliobacillus quinghaiensis]